MSRKTFELTSLQTHKQMLLLESELNRAQLIVEWRDLQKSLQPWKQQANAVSSMASSVARMGTVFSNFFRGWTGRSGAGEKRSWLATLLNGASTGVSFWSALKSKSR